MSLEFFELLEKIEKPEVKTEIVTIFSNDYTFAKIGQIIKEDFYLGVDFSTVVNMFKYYGIQVGYGKDLFEMIHLLETSTGKDEEKYERLRKPKITTDKKLLLLMTTMRSKSKHHRYVFLKDLFLSCNKIQFEWVMKIICNPESVGCLL